MLHATESETLYIQRRRLQVSQAERASDLQIPEYLYVDYENGKTIPRKLVSRIKVITDIEECVLKRRRCRMTQADVAAILHVSRLWVNRMERGIEPADRLIDYWRS